MKALKARPICDVCNKTVDEITEEVDALETRVTWAVRCHGERERVVVPADVFRAAPVSIDFGRAFVGARRLGS